jgi:hypothetical protein
MLATPLAAAVAGGVAATPVQLAQAPAPAQVPAPPPATSPQSPPAGAAPGAQAPAAGGAQTPAAGQSAETKAETVEQRIASLHAALQITSQEEPKWTRVAQVMRENAAAMERLIADRDKQDAATVTAVQDLMEYEKFAQAHATGLRKLTTAFDALYKSMPTAQQKVADQVFQNFGHHGASAAHS